MVEPSPGPAGPAWDIRSTGRSLIYPLSGHAETGRRTWTPRKDTGSYLPRSKDSGITALRPGLAAQTAGPGSHNRGYRGSSNPSERYAHGMRNGGDRVPSGTSGRRHRATGPEAPARTGGNGGASLFTPAYRASHTVSGTHPVSADQDSADQDQTAATDQAAAAGGVATGHDRAGSDQPGAGSSWLADDRPAADYGSPDPGYDQGAGYGLPTGYEQSGGYGQPASYDQPAGYSTDAGYGSAGPDGQVADDERGAGYSWAGDDLTSAGYSWSRPDPSDDAGTERQLSRAVRGFPPSPGEPLPSYPPGPFAAWNRSAPADDPERRPVLARTAGDADSSRQLTVATITPTEFDTDYSLPAIKDPILRAAGSRTSAGPGPRPSAPPVANRGRTAGSHGGRAAKPTRKQPVRLAIGAAVAIIAAVTAVLVISGIGGTSSKGHPTAAQSSPSTPGASAPALTPPPGRWAFIGTQATDPVPLTMSELYPLSFAESGVFYKRTVAAKSGNCIAGIIGQALQAAVRQSSCKQIVRATYLSRAVKMMATIGVLNLKSFADATKTARAAGHSDFIAQLAAKTGPTSQIGSGTGIEVALVKGHYLILVWAEFLKLHAPRTSTQRQELAGFITLLVRQTVNVSLTNRMVDDTPLPAAG
jgi:hypothetical protein